MCRCFICFLTLLTCGNIFQNRDVHLWEVISLFKCFVQTFTSNVCIFVMVSNHYVSLEYIRYAQLLDEWFYFIHTFSSRMGKWIKEVVDNMIVFRQ